ncbi:unannotated protein [freshwater metagenome]|uniref:Unannotated protein n=1 Tax=freshwater metagenome TaxID=449393 RepID=A0A6J7CXP9_9ZZZZ
MLALTAGLLIVAACWRTSRLHEPSHLWAAATTIVLALVMTEAVPKLWRLLPTPGALAIVIASSAAAVFACVPETSDQMGDLALVIMVGFVLEVFRRRQLPVWWHLGTGGLVLWSGVYGAYGRQSALIGAFFAQWPVLIVPLVLLVRPRMGRAREALRWLIAAFGAVAAILVARTGALQPTATPALTSVAVWGAASLIAALIAALAGSRSIAV